MHEQVLVHHIITLSSTGLACVLQCFCGLVIIFKMFASAHETIPENQELKAKRNRRVNVALISATVQCVIFFQRQIHKIE